MQSVAVELPHPLAERWVRLEVAEGAKFRRQRERAELGWAYAQRESDA